MPRHGRIAYETYGTYRGDNGVLVPTYYGGTDKSYAPMIGPGRALDPAKWFIVVPNMLGNGVSDSPSNNPDYAPATLRDNVRAQRALLDDLGVTSLHLIYGWSMGAMQAFAWAAIHPEFVRAILPVCGTARCWPLNQVFLEGMKATLPAGRAAFGRAYCGWAYSARFFRDALYKNLGHADLPAFLKYWEADHEAQAEADLLAMIWTWQQGFLTDAELAGIRARVIAMPCNTDAYFTVEEARLELANIPGAALRVLISPYGHCAGAPGASSEDTAQIEAEMRALLD